jgi:hypothetical protein
VRFFAKVLIRVVEYLQDSNEEYTKRLMWRMKQEDGQTCLVAWMHTGVRTGLMLGSGNPLVIIFTQLLCLKQWRRRTCGFDITSLFCRVLSILCTDLIFLLGLPAEILRLATTVSMGMPMSCMMYYLADIFYHVWKPSIILLEYLYELG